MFVAVFAWDKIYYCVVHGGVLCPVAVYGLSMVMCLARI